MGGSDLIQRRAVFVYEAARSHAIAIDAPIVPPSWSYRDEGFRDQFCRVIERECGPDAQRDPEALHADWVEAYHAMGWRWGREYDTQQKTHPDMVAYGALGQKERSKDAVFVMLCDIARQWIH
jgi:RyR domain